MKKAARELKTIGCRWVVMKGGHLDIESQAIDVLFDGKELILFRSLRWESTYTHGSGCTFASAITAGLAKGRTPPDSVKRAKDYVTEAIRKGFSIGSGHGPTNHLAGLSSKW
jgi:hydroxymethylpyrimidine/phosphomethylpyrimidine kinase